MAKTYLAENIKTLMRVRNESMNAVADACGLMASTVFRISNGSINKPRSSTLVALASHFGTSVEALVNEPINQAAHVAGHTVSMTGLPIPLLADEGIQAVFIDKQTISPESKGVVKRWLPPSPDGLLRMRTAALEDAQLNNSPFPLFAYTCKGAAMSPDFNEGDIVYVLIEDVAKIKTGDFVLALPEEGKTSPRIRQFITSDDSTVVYLKTTAEAWPGERFSPCKPESIIGRVVGVYRQFY